MTLTAPPVRPARAHPPRPRPSARLPLTFRLAGPPLVVGACGGSQPSPWPPAPQMQTRACTPITGGSPGSEDIVVDDRGGVAFISSYPRRTDKRRSAGI